jgi:hypothetical protein
LRGAHAKVTLAPGQAEDERVITIEARP